MVAPRELGTHPQGHDQYFFASYATGHSSQVVRAFHRHRKDLGLIPAGGPIVDDELFSNVPDLNFDVCMISTRTKTHYPSEIGICSIIKAKRYR